MHDSLPPCGDVSAEYVVEAANESGQSVESDPQPLSAEGPPCLGERASPALPPEGIPPPKPVIAPVTGVQYFPMRRFVVVFCNVQRTSTYTVLRDAGEVVELIPPTVAEDLPGLFAEVTASEARNISTSCSSTPDADWAISVDEVLPPCGRVSAKFRLKAANEFGVVESDEMTEPLTADAPACPGD